jgi:hypothetical protein
MPDQVMSVPGQAAAPKKDRGRRSCCGCAVAAAVLGAVAVIGVAWYLYHFAMNRVLQKEPLDIPAVAYTPGELKTLKARAEQARTAPRPRLALTDRELNVLVDAEKRAGKLKELVGFEVTFEGDGVRVRASLKAENDRYVNLEWAGRARIVNGELELDVREGRIGVLDLAKLAGPKAMSKKIVEEIYKNEEAREALRKIRLFEVRDGRAVLEMERRPRSP